MYFRVQATSPEVKANLTNEYGDKREGSQFCGSWSNLKNEVPECEDQVR